MNANELTILGAICRQFGTRVENGYEIHIPMSTLLSVGKGSLQQLPDNQMESIGFRYIPEPRIIDATMELIKDEAVTEEGALVLLKSVQGC
jgi:hypothetical protein